MLTDTNRVEEQLNSHLNGGFVHTKVYSDLSICILFATSSSIVELRCKHLCD